MTANKKSARLVTGTDSNTANTYEHCSPLSNFISRLEKVRKTGPGRYVACCPAHEDKSPSMTIRELDDERVLLHCFSGCSIHEIVRAVGLTLTDLFPREPGHHCPPERRPFPAVDVLKAIGFESLVVCAAAVTMISGEPFTPADRERLVLAASRIQEAMTIAGVRHDAS